MKVSVVMCAYNVRPYIKTAVESILKQTYDNWELIISDDCSTDGTREWLRSLEGHPKIRLFFQEKNIGYVANKNFAIEQATGDFITQNDSDDISSELRLEKQISIVQKYPEIRIVACGYEKIDNDGKVYNTIQSDIEHIIERPVDVYPFWFPPLLVHKSIYKEIGLYTSFFMGMGDDLYWTVKANERTPIYCLKEVLYSYRTNPSSITMVLNNERKLIVPALLTELINQRKLNKRDWLEENNLNAIAEFESSLLKNKRYMGEQYRVWAAKYIDRGNLKQAKPLLKKALRYNPFSKLIYNTLLYFIRKKLTST